MPNLSPEYVQRKAGEAVFDAHRETLAAKCEEYRKEGLTLDDIADKLNKQSLKTKMGKAWTGATVHHLLRVPRPPSPKATEASAARARKAERKVGLHRQNDMDLRWAAHSHPHLKDWRLLCSEWLRTKEAGLGPAIMAVNAFIDFMVRTNLPPQPPMLFLYKTEVPDFYEVMWGNRLSHGKVLVNNCVHAFLEWVLTKAEFTAEDDEGRLQTSPAFRNPIQRRSRSGIPQPSESVRSTLPYGYIEELRKMIAEGPNFQDWKWAQNAMGNSLGSLMGKHGKQLDSDVANTKVSPIWYVVDKELIDTADPDCVWRTRSRTVPQALGNRGRGRLKETIYEMWSPVRWVALLVKLQLPLRTLQVRMLDSGEADTRRWLDGEWQLNGNRLALGDERHPYSNGVFRQPNQLADGDARVLLHINTNKTADRDKVGAAKGYSVPWIVGGPMHQDPFYWLEKLRRWQEKYNPLAALTKWAELDGRHIPLKSDVQLANFPDTAFLFRTAENKIRPDFPLTAFALDRPWFHCLEELESRLTKRGELMPNGDRIRLVVSHQPGERKWTTTLFPLHSLRVSLITALAVDGHVPLAILQKIAGHSRLIMTLYYTKPGAMQAREALQAGVKRLNESADESIADWLANAEYEELVRLAIANSPESLRVAVPEQKHLRAPSGWMAMVDGLCLVGGNNIEREAPGCHNGGPNIGNTTSPRYAPVSGGARNCPMCRWFITRPFFLPQLATRWNNVSYHCYDAREQVVLAEQRFREVEDKRASIIASDRPFTEQGLYKEAQRILENAVQKFDELTMTIAAITRLMERCRSALENGDGSSLVAIGTLKEFEYSIDEVSSELLQVSGVCEGTLLYPDLNPGKAVLRQSQLLDAALVRDNLAPVFLTLTEKEQKSVASALLKQLALQMNPLNPVLGRYQVISLIDARSSLTNRFGLAVEQALRSAAVECVPHRVVPIQKLPELVP